MARCVGLYQEDTLYTKEDSNILFCIKKGASKKDLIPIKESDIISTLRKKISWVDQVLFEHNDFVLALVNRGDYSDKRISKQLDIIFRDKATEEEIFCKENGLEFWDNFKISDKVMLFPKGYFYNLPYNQRLGEIYHINGGNLSLKNNKGEHFAVVSQNEIRLISREKYD